MQTTQPPGPKAATRSHGVADKLGVLAASACAVHCLAAPVVLAFAPLLGSAWASPATHWIFASVSIPAALLLLRRNLKGRAGGRGIMALAVLGSLFVALGLAAPGASWSQNKGVHLPLPSAAAAFLGEPEVDGCTDECCASVHAHSGSAPRLFIPFASLVTMLGGILLVTAHGASLRGLAGCGHS